MGIDIDRSLLVQESKTKKKKKKKRQKTKQEKKWQERLEIESKAKRRRRISRDNNDRGGRGQRLLLWNRIYDPIIYPPPSSSSFSLEGWKDVWMNGYLDEWKDGRMFGWMDGCKVEWLGVWMVNNTSGVWTHNLFWREVPKGSRQGLDRSPSHQPWCIHSFVEQFSALIYLILEFFWVFWCNWGSYLTESYTLS